MKNAGIQAPTGIRESHRHGYETRRTEQRIAFRLPRISTCINPSSMPKDLLGIRGGDDDLNIDVGLDGDRGDLLHGLGRRVEVDDTLVYAHLEAIPGVGSLTARGLADSHAEHLGGHADGALDLEVLLLGTLDEVSADLKGDHVREEVPSDGCSSVSRPGVRTKTNPSRWPSRWPQIISLAPFPRSSASASQQG